MPDRPRVEFIVEALPDDDRPIGVRLRHLLKYALRGQRLKCVSYRPVTAKPGANGTAAVAGK